MTPAQEERVVVALEKIAEALQPKASGRDSDPASEQVPGGGGRRVKMAQLIESVLEARVKPTALKPKQ